MCSSNTPSKSEGLRSIVYTAVSEMYSRWEQVGKITDEELETRILQLQGMSLCELSELYVNLFDKPVSSLED